MKASFPKGTGMCLKDAKHTNKAFIIFGKAWQPFWQYLCKNPTGIFAKIPLVFLLFLQKSHWYFCKNPSGIFANNWGSFIRINPVEDSFIKQFYGALPWDIHATQPCKNNFLFFIF